jgi:protein involved in temperature-dependent protein secretion
MTGRALFILETIKVDALLEVRDLVRGGRLSQALQVAKDAARAAPSELELRSALFGLFAANGEDGRAETQLSMCARLGGQDLARQYGSVFVAQQQRREVILGRADPAFGGEDGPEWYSRSKEALIRLAAGEEGPLAKFVAEQDERLDTVDGSLGDREFTGFRNADARLRGVLEVAAEGRYIWLPVEDVTAILLPERPEFLIDLLWLPAMIHRSTGNPVMGYLFGTYPGTEDGAEVEKLGRTTGWNESEAVDLGSGLQLFLAGDEVVPLPSLGGCQLNTPGGNPDEETQE